MTILTAKINASVITLNESLFIKNLGGHSIYSITLVTDNKTSIKDLGNNKTKALHEFQRDVLLLTALEILETEKATH